MKQKRLNKIQRRLARIEIAANALKGSGLYVYKNNTKGDLELPKATATGVKRIRPNEEFQGDSYFMNLVKTNDLIFIRAIASPIINERKPMEEKKLILDQPDRYTQQGKTEQVLPIEKHIKLNENQPDEDKKATDILINEDPLSGVEIILN